MCTKGGRGTQEETEIVAEKQIHAHTHTHTHMHVQQVEDHSHEQVLRAAQRPVVHFAVAGLHSGPNLHRPIDGPAHQHQQPVGQAHDGVDEALDLVIGDARLGVKLAFVPAWRGERGG